MDYKNTLAENLKRRRLILGLDQSQLAELADISRMAYVKIESSKSMPQEETLDRLSKALHISVFELFEKTETPETLLFRTRKTQTARESACQNQTIQNACKWLKDYVFLMNAAGKRSSANSIIGFQRKPCESIRDFALSVRKSVLAKCHESSLNDLSGVLESLGVKLLFTPFLTSKCFGFSFGIKDGGPAIIVNTGFGIPAERQLFTLIHELGHLLLHKDAYGVDAGDESPKQEKEADEFAAEFLMPHEAFKNAWETRDGMLWFDRILAVKQIFKVSYKTVLHRLQEDGSKKPVHAWFQNGYERRFGRMLLQTIEPCPSQIVFAPGGYVSMAREAFFMGEISESKLAELLGVSLSDTRKRIVDWNRSA